VGALKTSEQGESVAGEGVKDPTADDRPVDSGAKIIIGPDTGAGPPQQQARMVAPTAPRTHRASTPPLTLPKRRVGLGLVVVLYVLSAAALAWSIYERFVA
jgi:hypothetical protein